MLRRALLMPVCGALLAGCGAEGRPFVPGVPAVTDAPSSLGPIGAPPAGTLIDEAGTAAAAALDDEDA